MTLKLQHVSYSQRMGARIAVLDATGETVAMLEVKVLRQRSQTIQAAAEGVTEYVLHLQDAFGIYKEVNADKKRLTRELDLALHGPEGAAPQASLCDLVGPAGDLRDQYKQACDRLFDMLLGDDGQAFSEAEAFLKRHQPDLYNRIGLSVQTAMKGV